MISILTVDDFLILLKLILYFSPLSYSKFQSPFRCHICSTQIFQKKIVFHVSYMTKKEFSQILNFSRKPQNGNILSNKYSNEDIVSAVFISSEFFSCCQIMLFQLLFRRKIKSINVLFRENCRKV